MGLSDIAAGIEVTDEQDDCGVATVDDTDATLAQRLEQFADSLPCSPSEAATVLERYSDGGSVGAAGRAAGIAPTTAAKTLHLLGESVSPLGPMGREIVEDYIEGRLSRSEAIELTREGENTFALAVWIETHDSLEDASEAIEGMLVAQHAQSVTGQSDLPDFL